MFLPFPRFIDKEFVRFREGDGFERCLDEVEVVSAVRTKWSVCFPDNELWTKSWGMIGAFI